MRTSWQLRVKHIDPMTSRRNRVLTVKKKSPNPKSEEKINKFGMMWYSHKGTYHNSIITSVHDHKEGSRSAI